MKKKEITIDGVKYVSEDSIRNSISAETREGYPFVLVRGNRSGIYFGYLKEQKGQECILLDARNAWYWSGAASHLQMAVNGVSNPDNCKFTKPVREIKLTDVISITQCTKEAQDNLSSVFVWEK